MPLFMDFHKFDKVTVEDVKAAHIADEAIQEKYGVKYHQFWVNEDASTVFCLVEGPDAETCELVHKTAHGNIACALTEVEPGFYEKLMGRGYWLDYGLVRNRDNTIDQGYRAILVVSVAGTTNHCNSKEILQLRSSARLRKLIVDQVSLFNGRELIREADASISAVFDDATKAVECALQIHQLPDFKEREDGIIFKTGISAAQPVTPSGDFFQSAIKLAHHLCVAAQKNQVMVSSLVNQLCKEELLQEAPLIKPLSIREEEFISNLINIAEERLNDETFDLDKLCIALCISRPQLYRKIMSLTGRSPNDFIRDLRMNKAVLLLKQNKANITEVAFETGFNSPSYFSKCFAEKFGCTPSTFLKANLQ